MDFVLLTDNRCYRFSSDTNGVRTFTSMMVPPYKIYDDADFDDWHVTQINDWPYEPVIE